MKHSRLNEVTLPSYTFGEEVFNMVSHIVGVALGIVATVLCVIFASMNHNVYGVIGGAIFGASMIILYSMSSIYHGLSPKIKAKKVFRVLDHCAIYFLVSGTITPIALCTIREYSAVQGWVLFGIIWGLTAFGITMTALNTDKFKKLSLILYLGMGWSVVIAKNAIVAGLGTGGMILIFAGGIAYTIGAVLYSKGKKKKYMHSVFHLFVVAGSLLHFLCILLYVI